MLEENKEIVKRWFKTLWGKDGDPSNIDELSSPNIQVTAPLQGVLHGRENVKNFIEVIHQAFPDIHFWIVGDLIAEGNYVVARWDGGGTHTGIALPDFPGGPIPVATGKKVRFTGITIYRLQEGKVAEEITEEGAWAMLKQIGLIHSNP